MAFDVKQSLVRLSAALSIARAFAPSPRASITTLLFHRFFVDGEDRETGLDRLKRQCEWLRDKYVPLTPTAALDDLRTGDLPSYPLIVTADDAKLDLLHTHRIFREFEIPLTIFVGVGWAVNGSPPEEDTLLAQIADFFRWFEGPEQEIFLGNGKSVRLGAEWNDESLDRILRFSRRDERDLLEQIWERRPIQELGNWTRKTCNWSELVDLQSEGAEIGSHTVTHIRLAEASDVRIEFELGESKRILEKKFGYCDHFAYPYGTPDVASIATTEEIKRQGYKSAFLTNLGFATNADERYHMPRISIPDGTTHFGEFRARTRGGAIPITAIKRWGHGLAYPDQ